MAKNLEESHFKANFFLGLKERIADDLVKIDRDYDFEKCENSGFFLFL